MIYPTDILSLESWILLITALGLIRYHVYRKYQYLAKLNISHDPPSLLKFGTAAAYFDKEKMFSLDNEQKAKHGAIYGGYVVLTPSITIHDPEILRHIFIKEFSKFPERQNIFTKCNGKELNHGLNLVKGEDWKRMRSTMSPNFSSGKMKEMVQLMEWCANHATDYLKRKCDKNGGVFNAKELFSKLSLDIVCSVAFSTDVHSLDEGEEPEIVKNARKIFDMGIYNPKIYLCLFVPFMEDLFEKMNWSIIESKLVKYFKNIVNVVIDKQHSHSIQKRMDFLQLMLESETSEEKIANGQQKGLTRTEIVGNAMVLVLAGYENTANTLGFLSYNFAQYPEYQTRVQEEIDAAIKRDGRLNQNNVHDMKYLDMCLNESLRLYTPILRNARVCKEETTINGFTIPKDIVINVPTYGLAHDPEYWDKPFEFKPERMEDMNQIDAMLYQPFGAGPRNCIAKRFAIMEVKMCICKILEKFTIVPCDDTLKPPLDLVQGSSIRPATAIKLRVIPRGSAE